MESWSELLSSVKDCKKCQDYPWLKAVSGAKAENGYEPPDPKKVLDFSRPITFFVSEAPAGGTECTFFYCNGPDTWRENLFEVMTMGGLNVRIFDGSTV